MYTIKKNREFRSVYSAAPSLADKYLVLYYTENQTTESRFGISVSGKVGHAVVRNKIKRRIKEILRLKHDRIEQGYDIIFIVRVRAADASYDRLNKSVTKLLSDANLIIQQAAEQ